MANTFPRELVSHRQIRKSTWSLNDGNALSRSAGGKAISVVDQYDPWFSADFETVPMSPADRRKWSAWKNSLQGGMKSFVAYDASRSFPIAYPGGVPEIIGETWNGSGTVSALTARTMTILGVPSGYKASAGDHVGLVQNNRYSVHEIVEDAASNGLDELSLTFEPYVSLQMFTIGATAVLWRPKARFVLDPASWDDEGDIEFLPISFTGLQVF